MRHTPGSDMNQVLLGEGVVRHNRLRPVVHAFAYRTYFVVLPLRSLRGGAPSALPRGRWGLLSFADQDHGDGRADCLAWVEALLQAQGIWDADGEIWLQCFPRVLGFVFNPISLWFCHDRAGNLMAVLAEVNNTFGEQKHFIMASPKPTAAARKDFYVSPFISPFAEFKMRIAAPGEKIDIGIHTHGETGAELVAEMNGSARPLTGPQVMRLFLKYPLHTVRVIVLIHWFALRLLLRRVPFFPKATAEAAVIHQNFRSHV